MPVSIVTGFIYGSILLSLFAIDYVLGNGFADVFQVLFCKIVCVVRKTIREEEKLARLAGPEPPISLAVVVTEFLVLILTLMFLKKYKQYQSKDRIDELLQESKDALKQTNEFLEKWRLRRVPTEYSYLDDEPQEITPLKLEVPILHMAIIDTLRTTRSKPERGDAGDAYNITDSTLLSVTSLLDDDLESLNEKRSQENIEETSDNRVDSNNRNVEFKDSIDCLTTSDSTLLSVTSLLDDDLESLNEKRSQENIEETSDNRVDSNNRNVEFKFRYLWDVMEEDTNTLDED